MESGTFNLLCLPLPALSMVLYWLDVPTAFALARTNRRLLAAFRDEMAWRRRCVALLGPEEMPVSAAAPPSWMAHYRERRAG